MFCRPSQHLDFGLIKAEKDSFKRDTQTQSAELDDDEDAHVVFQAQKVSDDLLQKIGSKNRRALDLVAAKCYYYHARVYEFLNQFDSMRRYTHTHTQLS